MSEPKTCGACQGSGKIRVTITGEQAPVSAAEKSLGQVAYEAWQRARFQGDQVGWNHPALSKSRQAWEAAAEAVADVIVTAKVEAREAALFGLDEPAD